MLLRELLDRMDNTANPTAADAGAAVGDLSSLGGINRLLEVATEGKPPSKRKRRRLSEDNRERGICTEEERRPNWKMNTLSNQAAMVSFYRAPFHYFVD